jgi:sugar phosphate isomerase/epimerase
MSDLRDRIGIDVGRRLEPEQAVDWAILNDVRFFELCLDPDADLLLAGAERAKAIRARLEGSPCQLGLHTLSAVNMAETSPLIAEAVEEYIRAYIRASRRLGAGWVVVHAGFHFTKDKQDRMKAGLERLKRVTDYAEKQGAVLMLENMNPEPADAEVKYLAHDVEECHYYFDQITSPALKWSYTVNHAHILPIGIEAFTAAMDVSRCGQVRVADCHGTVEEHLPIGQGTIDFARVFQLLEGRGFRGPYIEGFTTLDDMLAGRETLSRIASDALVR